MTPVIGFIQISIPYPTFKLFTCICRYINGKENVIAIDTGNWVTILFNSHCFKHIYLLNSWLTIRQNWLQFNILDTEMYTDTAVYCFGFTPKEISVLISRYNFYKNLRKYTSWSTVFIILMFLLSNECFCSSVNFSIPTYGKMKDKKYP